MNKNYVLAVDIGGTNIRFGLVDRSYNLKDFVRKSSQSVLAGRNAAASLRDALIEYLDGTDAAGKVAAIIIGIPGQVRKDRRYIYSVPKIQGLSNLALGTILERTFDCPVFVEHDVSNLLTHDIRTMNLDPDRNKTILGIYVGTGMGNCLYIDGRIHMGTHGVAAELGHIPLYGVEDVCSCGAVGCVETRSCGAYLAKLVEKEFPDCNISEIFSKHSDDPRIIKFVKDTAIPIAIEVTLLDPDYVLLGGGVLTMEDFPMQLLEEEVRRLARHPLPANDINFVYASDSQANGVIGGGMIAWDLIG